MKKLYYLQTLGLCIIILQACSKNSGNNSPALPSSNSINVVISPNQAYELNLTASGSVSIFKQASHYQTSQTFADAENNSITYKYLPDASYRGKDQVMLSTTSLTTTTSSNNSGRECPNSAHADNTGSAAMYTTTYTTINITVTN
jgi:hypothetical protein